jgi:hypothetical protein
MRKAAAEAGQWEYKGETYDRIQILTVKQIVREKARFGTPTKVGIKDPLDQGRLAL